MLNGVCLMSEKVTRTKNNAIQPKIMNNLQFPKELKKNAILIFNNQKTIDKPTCESMPLLMINFFRACSSAGVGFLSVDLGVGTGFRLVAGDPGVTEATEPDFASCPFMSEL